MQLSGRNGKRLADLRRGEHGVIAAIELPDDIARRLMELGFLPGGIVKVGRSAPGGDPRVFEVDGSEVALRRETSRLIHLEAPSAQADAAANAIETPGQAGAVRG
ncbi:MAG: FeoA family protein [Bryobacteraceae bacterium]